MSDDTDWKDARWKKDGRKPYKGYWAQKSGDDADRKPYFDCWMCGKRCSIVNHTYPYCKRCEKHVRGR